MKKRVILTLLLINLLLTLLFINLVSADLGDSIGQTAEKIEEKAENVEEFIEADKEEKTAIATNYTKSKWQNFKEQWRASIERSPQAKTFLEYIDLVSEFLVNEKFDIGIKYLLTWIIFVTLTEFLARFLSELLKSKPIGITASIAGVLLLFKTTLISQLLDIPLNTKFWWLFSILIISAVIGSVIWLQYSIKKDKKAEEEEIEKLKTEADKVELRSKGYKV